MSKLILLTSDTYKGNIILAVLSQNPIIVVLAAIRFLYSMLYKKLPVRFFLHSLYAGYTYLAGFLGVYFDLNLLPLFGYQISMYMFLLFVDLYWMFKHSTKPKVIGFNILIIGSCVSAPLMIYFALTQLLGLIPDFIPFLPPDRMAHVWIIFILMMAIFLAKNIQATNLSLKQLNQNLEKRIEERTLELTQTNKKLLQSEKEARDELADAHDMQVALLPESAPVIPGLEIAGSSLPAKEVGGDFFDYFEKEKKLLIVVGDVSGKGLKAAMNAVMASGILNLSTEYQDQVNLIMSDVNDSLYHSFERNINATAIIAQFDTEKKQMDLANAGQHALPLLKRNSSVAPILAKGFPLGMKTSISYKPITIQLQSGDLLLFMTDGITEPHNSAGLMYEESGRLHQLISQLKDDLTAEEIVETIIEDVIDFMEDDEKRDDDITLLAVKVV